MAVAHLGKENLPEIHPFHILELALVRKGTSVCAREKPAVFTPHRHCSASALRLLYAFWESQILPNFAAVTSCRNLFVLG